jgi:hypothetical protein
MQREVLEWKDGETYVDLETNVSNFLDDVGTRHPHTFSATDFKQSLERNQAAKDILEFLMGMHCRMGREVLGNGLRKQLRVLIHDANLVVADLACRFQGESSELKININTCVEAGMAIAHNRPLFLIRWTQPCAIQMQKRPTRFHSSFETIQSSGIAMILNSLQVFTKSLLIVAVELSTTSCHKTEWISLQPTRLH